MMAMRADYSCNRPPHLLLNQLWVEFIYAAQNHL
jgi:hypothetical protein